MIEAVVKAQIASAKEVSKYGLNKNLASRVFEFLPKVFGERGGIFVGGYQYLAWVDDVVDESRDLTTNEKSKFLDRQIDLVRGKSPDNPTELEQLFNDLPWHLVDEKKVKKQVEIILYGVQDDLKAMPLVGRSKAQIKQAEWRTTIPTLRIASLVLNGKDLKITPGLAKLAEVWSAKDDINHFYEDIDDGLLKLPLEFDERQSLNSLETDKRKEAIFQLFPEQKLVSMQWQNIAGMARYAPAAFTSEVSNSQKLIFAGYLFYRLTSASIKNLNRARLAVSSNVIR